MRSRKIRRDVILCEMSNLSLEMSGLILVCQFSFHGLVNHFKVARTSDLLRHDGLLEKPFPFLKNVQFLIGEFVGGQVHDSVVMREWQG